MSNRLTPATAMDQTVYILAYPDGSLVGLDDASGGYPWRPRHWAQIQKWRTPEEAERYMGVMNREGFVMLKANLVITEIDD